MASEGPLYPGSVTSDSSFGSTSWSSPGNASADDGSDASAVPSGSSTHYLNCQSFGFSIPSGATIDGIEVEVERWSNGAFFEAKDSRVRIIKGGTVGSTDFADTVNPYPTSATIKTYGGPTELWGETWAASDINASNFGFALSAQNHDATGFALVDFVRITVYYSGGGTVITKTHTTDSFLKDSSTKTHTTDAYLSKDWTDDTYYFDASDAGPTDPDTQWSGDASAFDGSTSTSATTGTQGSTSSNYLMGEGTTAPSSATDTIYRVWARIYQTAGLSIPVAAAIYTDGLGELLGTPTAAVSGAWGSYTELSAPTGGWTWQKLSDLEVKIYKNVGGGSTANAAKVEILVRNPATPNIPFSKEARASLPSDNDDDLATIYTSQEATDIETADDAYASLSGVGYLIHQFKFVNVNNTDPFRAECELQTKKAPSAATVYLQVFNRTDELWETIDSDSSSAASTDFELSGTISASLSEYYDGNNTVSFRVYQEIT